VESPRHGPDLLRTYLADRDVACDCCGYNLRGVTDVFCPECGRVIPRPPADAVRRISANRVNLRLYCTRCGYVVTGADPGRCPECGVAEMAQFSGDRPPRIARRWWSRVAPLPLLLLAPLGVCVAMTAAAVGLGRSVGGRARGPVDPWLGMLLGLGPAVIAAAWMWHRARIAALEPGERKGLAAVACLVSLGMLIAALRSLG
jgi:hypothetical protein